LKLTVIYGGENSLPAQRYSFRENMAAAFFPLKPAGMEGGMLYRRKSADAEKAPWWPMALRTIGGVGMLSTGLLNVASHRGRHRRPGGETLPQTMVM